MLQCTFVFYTNSNLPVTKILLALSTYPCSFYTNSNLPVTKIAALIALTAYGFTLTQIFQLLKSVNFASDGTSGFTLTQIFQLLKYQIALMKRLPQKTIINISVTANIIIITYSRAVKKNFLLNVPVPFSPLFR